MIFDEELLNEIKSRADIVDVISTFIHVIKKGNRYQAVCPFHDDHDPSLQINREKKTYHCWACNAGGDVFEFVKEYEKVSFAEAVKRVCEIINFDDPRLHQNETIKAVPEDIQKLYNCITDLQKFYVAALNSPDGKEGKDYITNRGLTKDQILKFGIGYAFKDGKLAIKYLKQKGYSLKNIQDIGIALAKDENTSDSNSGRLIFPIQNSSGQVVGFSARKLTNEDETAPKYVNTGETKLFKKSTILYNLHNAKQAAKHDGYIYVMEGFMDVIAMDAAGIAPVVAVMGKALTEQQINILKRLNVEVRLCLDNDIHGQKAMLEIGPMLKKAGVPYRVVSDPNEKMKDTDDILHKESAEKLKEFASKLVEPFEFAINFYKKYQGLETREDKIKFLRKIVPSISKIKDKYERIDYVNKLSEITGFSVPAIEEFIKDTKSNLADNRQQESLPAYEHSNLDMSRFKREMKRLLLAERSILQLMVTNSEAVEYYSKNIRFFSIPVYKKIADYVLQLSKDGKKVDASSVITAIQQADDQDAKSLLGELSSLEEIDIPIEDIGPYLEDCARVINSERKKLTNKNIMKEAFMGKDAKEQALLLDDYIAHTNVDDKKR